jgi:SAM-dependent methyltransferase
VVPTITASPELVQYYATVAPFYEREMALRTDLPAWCDLVSRTAARSVLDLGCGYGRLSRALAGRTEVIGIDVLPTLVPADPGFEFVRADMRDLPFPADRFDLAIAANDPFAHLLNDRDRGRALDEAGRVARRVVIDGLSLTPVDDARARTSALMRQAVLPDGIRRQEIWSAVGAHRYRTTYRYLRGETVLAEATTDVHAWSRDEPALRGRDARLYGGLDGRAHDPEGSALVISIGGTL